MIMFIKVIKPHDRNILVVDYLIKSVGFKVLPNVTVSNKAVYRAHEKNTRKC